MVAIELYSFGRRKPSAKRAFFEFCVNRGFRASLLVARSEQISLRTV